MFAKHLLTAAILLVPAAALAQVPSLDRSEPSRWTAPDENSVEAREFTPDGLRRHLAWRQDVLRFANGQATPTTRAAMRRALHEWGHDPRVQKILKKQVPSPGRGELKSNSAVVGILNPDKSLTTPPPALIGRPGTALGRARLAFEKCWADLVADPSGDWVISGRQIRNIRLALERWQAAVDEPLSFVGRQRAKEHFLLLRSLVDQVEDPKRRPRIQAYLCQGGFALAGDGNVRQLVEYLIRHDVAVEPGTKAQFALAQLAGALVEADKSEKLALRKPKPRKPRPASSTTTNPTNDWYLTTVPTYRPSYSSYTIPTYRYRTYYRTYTVPQVHTYSVPTYRTRTYTYTIRR